MADPEIGFWEAMRYDLCCCWIGFVKLMGSKIRKTLYRSSFSSGSGTSWVLFMMYVFPLHSHACHSSILCSVTSPTTKKHIGKLKIESDGYAFPISSVPARQKVQKLSEIVNNFKTHRGVRGNCNCEDCVLILLWL